MDLSRDRLILELEEKDTMADVKGMSGERSRDE
jgi:hypothetical protein